MTWVLNLLDSTNKPSSSQLYVSFYLQPSYKHTRQVRVEINSLMMSSVGQMERLKWGLVARPAVDRWLLSWLWLRVHRQGRNGRTWTPIWQPDLWNVSDLPGVWLELLLISTVTSLTAWLISDRDVSVFSHNAFQLLVVGAKMTETRSLSTDVKGTDPTFRTQNIYCSRKKYPASWL